LHFEPQVLPQDQVVEDLATLIVEDGWKARLRVIVTKVASLLYFAL